jgi:hypothetical protein
MEAHFRRALRVLRVVHELHKQGHQLLRIAPGMAPSGLSWRCAISPRFNILKSHGAMLKDFDRCTAHYTSAQENEYFGWRDAKHDDVRQLTAKFSERFPEILEAGQGDDWNYAGWYVKMLGYAERGLFPVAYEDCWGYEDESDPRFLPLTAESSDLPMPPPGDAEDEGERDD